MNKISREVSMKNKIENKEKELSEWAWKMMMVIDPFHAGPDPTWPKEIKKMYYKLVFDLIRA